MWQHNRDRRGELLTQNFLWIGYHAWMGYLTRDRGMLVLNSDRGMGEPSGSHWGDDLLAPSLRYIPHHQLSLYLQEWLVDPNSIESILTAVNRYQPETEIILAIESSPDLDIALCQRLKISPPDCYQQVWRRWSEFQLVS